MRAGTLLKRMLTAIGITEERYKEIKELFGLPPECKCPEREEWLNNVVDHAIEKWNIPMNSFIRLVLHRKNTPRIPYPPCPKCPKQTKDK